MTANPNSAVPFLFLSRRGTRCLVTILLFREADIDGLKSKLIQTFDTVENKVEELQVAVKDAEGFVRKCLLSLKTWRTTSAKNMIIPGIFNATFVTKCLKRLTI